MNKKIIVGLICLAVLAALASSGVAAPLKVKAYFSNN
jgi:hypothetical protein